MQEEKFKVISIQPVFLSKDERLKLKSTLPQPEIKSAIIPVRSRSPDRKENAKFEKPKQKMLDLLKYRQTFRFEWDNADDTGKEISADSFRIIPAPLKGRISTKSQSSLKKSDLITKPIQNMAARDWKIFKENFYITCKSDILPIRNWEESELDRKLIRALRGLGYTYPTAIQMQAIPISIQRHDLIGLSHTGSGKSAAYLLPLVNHIMKLPKLDYDTNQDGPYALIISPTRELALQIVDECEGIIKYAEIRVYGIVGGKSVEEQGMELRKSTEIVIATPGRLLELLQMQYLVFNQCRWIIIDEADKIILLEQEETMREIFTFFPQESWKSVNNSSVFTVQQIENFKSNITMQIFSATMDAQIESMWRVYLKNPITVQITDTTKKIAQRFYFIEEGNKKNTLKNVLKDLSPPILVFMNEKVEADNLTNFLNYKWKAACLHGGKTQDIRETVMEKFREGRIDILISTDVVSRGINLKHLKYVINYDCPKSIIDYEHRIGRTGRMGKKGTAITFITPENYPLLPQISVFLKKIGQKVPQELEKQLENLKEAETITQ